MIEPFDSEAGYRAAIDATIAAATNELRIFDSDLRGMALDDAARHAALAAFLAGRPGRILRIVVHDAEPLRTRHPRLLMLMRRYGPLIEVRQTPAQLRHLADRFVLADQLHGAIRFHADQPRGNRVSSDNIEIHPLWQRFDDLWHESEACTTAAVAGL